MAPMIKLLHEYFWNPNKRIGVDLGRGGGSAEYDDLGKLLTAHLSARSAPVTVRVVGKGQQYTKSGRFRVGVYCPGEDGTTIWLCIDFDGGSKKSKPLKDAKGAAIKTLTALKKAGFPAA